METCWPGQQISGILLGREKVNLTPAPPKATSGPCQRWEISVGQKKNGVEKNRRRKTKKVSIVYMKNMSFRFTLRLLFCTAVPRSSSQNQEVLNWPLRRWMDEEMWLMLRALSRTQLDCSDFAPLNRGLFSCSSQGSSRSRAADSEKIRLLFKQNGVGAVAWRHKCNH